MIFLNDNDMAVTEQLTDNNTSKQSSNFMINKSNNDMVEELLKVIDQTVENGCNELLLNDDEIRGLKSHLHFEIKNYLGDTNLTKNYTDYGIRMQFLNKASNQSEIKLNLDPTEKFVSWLELSAFCLKGIIEYGDNYNLVPCLKEEIAKYVLESEELYDVSLYNEGKISLWNGFASFNVYSFKQLAYGTGWVLNGTRTFNTILEQMNIAYKEDSRMKNLFGYELYPFVEMNDTDLVKIKFKNSSFYEELYKVAKEKNPNWDKIPYIKKRLSAVYDIVKSDKSNIESKWKSLLLSYLPEDIINENFDKEFNDNLMILNSLIEDDRFVDEIKSNKKILGKISDKDLFVLNKVVLILGLLLRKTTTMSITDENIVEFIHWTISENKKVSTISGSLKDWNKISNNKAVPNDTQKNIANEFSKLLEDIIPDKSNSNFSKYKILCDVKNEVDKIKNKKMQKS